MKKLHHRAKLRLKIEIKMRVLFFFIILFCALGCKNEKVANFRNLKSILNNRPIESGGYKLYDDGSISYLYDTLNGKLFGNFFEFDLNSNLITYAFKTDSMHSTYIEYFDPETNKLLNMEGNPIVYVDIDADKSPDSLFIQYFITEFSWKDIEFDISEDGINYKRIPLYQHSKLKFIKVAEFERETKSLSRFLLIAKFKGRMAKGMEKKIFYDTIDVTKRKFLR